MPVPTARTAPVSLPPPFQARSGPARYTVPPPGPELDDETATANPAAPATPAPVDEPDDDDREADEPGAALEQEPAWTVSRFFQPQHPFLKGAVFGLIILIPLTALTVYLLGRLDIGDPAASYYSVIAFVAVFAGLPAIISGGGIGRAAASALLRVDGDGRKRSLRVAAVQTALAEVGLVLLSVVPLGEVPTEASDWASIIGFGAVAGALGGLLLGLWVAGYGAAQD